MKLELAAAIVVAATGVAAQSSSAVTSLSGDTTATPVYVTLTIDDCDTTAPPAMVTVTNGVTLTYCPKCEEEASSKTAATQVTPFTTIWTTTYMSLCTTGTSHGPTPVTYTITESCTEPTPTWIPGPSYIPPGFTTTEVVCHKCAETPVTYTVTQPCDCTHSGAGSPPPASATPTGSGDNGGGSGNNPGSGNNDSGNNNGGSSDPNTGGNNGGSNNGGSNDNGNPVTQISDGQVQAPTGNGGNPVTQISDGQVQAPTGNGGAPVTQISDGQVQAPTGGAGRPEGSPTGNSDKGNDSASTTVGCPGPQCKLSTAASPSQSSPASTSPVSFTGAASSFGVSGLVATALAVVVGSLAFLL